MRIADAAGVPFEEVVEYVSGHWDPLEVGNSMVGGGNAANTGQTDWSRDLASLDAAILALLDSEADETYLDAELDFALTGSLFSRQIAQQEERAQQLLRLFLTARARRIWSQTTNAQRRGYHMAGVGLSAGKFLDANIERLTELLLRAEKDLVDDSSRARY